MRKQLVFCAPLVCFAAIAQSQTVVFAADFNTSLPSHIHPGVAALEGVQNYAGLGPVDNRFGGSFLRSPTGNTVTLTLSNLPSHTSINVHFLFAAIDSLDGTGTYPEGDFLKLTVDGVQIFRESFANATADQLQSYVSPPGVTLARRVDLGFSGPGGYYTDSAYNLAADPRFSNIAHSASSVTVSWIIEGPGIQPLDDESWAMDNLRVSVNGCPADFNNDDFVDGFDYNDFVACFEGDPCPPGTSADFNNDGFPDAFDYDDFVAAFETGCL